MIQQILRWCAAVVMQLVFSFTLGLLVPFQVYYWTGWETLWMLPIGLVLGSWLGGWPIWPSCSRERWMCLLASASACILLIILMLIGVFGESAPFFWIPFLPILGFDSVAALYRYKKR